MSSSSWSRGGGGGDGGGGVVVAVGGGGSFGGGMAGGSQSGRVSGIGIAGGGVGGRWYVESDVGWIPVHAAYDSAMEAAHRRGDSNIRVAASALYGSRFDYDVTIPGFGGEAIQRNLCTGRTRSLRRLPLGDHVWQFLDSSIASASVVPWVTYPNTELLELGYQEATAAVSCASTMGGPAQARADLVTLSASGQPVYVDLVGLVERNVATGATRPIRRVPRSTILGLPSAPMLPSLAPIGGEGEHGDTEESVWRVLKHYDPQPPSRQCPICHDHMDVVASGGEAGHEAALVELRGCSGHFFHRGCVRPILKPNGSLKCPLCYKVSGRAPHVGTQPPGKMVSKTISAGVQTWRKKHGVHGLDGCGVIVIEYDIPSGIQGPDHPNPGRRYHGTRRTAYLPDTDEGREVLELLQVAWERKLIFTVGTSVTTGQSDCVVWAGIHHKTSTSGGTFGYPDDTYLSRVKEELKIRGVR